MSMGRALGRWQQVLMEALAEHKAVGVRAAVVGGMGLGPGTSCLQRSCKAVIWHRFGLSRALVDASELTVSRGRCCTSLLYGFVTGV
jgi:hypothetical protein